MSLTHPARAGTAVTIWLVDGVPVRLVYEGQRYRVTDMPTRLEEENPDLAHRLNLTGWRFQGTGEDGRSHMFDVRSTEAEWRLVRVYD